MKEWFDTSKEESVQERDVLRKGIETAIIALGTGFIQNAKNKNLKQILRDNISEHQVYYRQLLRITYRLIVIFVLEERDLLLIPTAKKEIKNRYWKAYSARKMRACTLNSTSSNSSGNMKSKKTSRNKLRVRSNSSVFKPLNKDDSKVLEDPQEPFDYLYKFIVIGDESVGKSNLLLRICKGIYQKKPKTTYGVEFEWKTY